MDSSQRPFAPNEMPINQPRPPEGAASNGSESSLFPSSTELMETNGERASEIPSAAKAPLKTSTSSSTTASSQNVSTQQSSPSLTAHQLLYKNVEHILEEDIEPYYRQMDPEDKKTFRQKGEEVSQQMTVLIESTKDVVSQMLTILLAWLGFIRGVSHMFIEELARKKIQKLLSLRNDNRDNH